MINVDKIEAGPQLDVLVAEHVLGFHWDAGTDDSPGCDGRRTLWGPPNDPKRDQYGGSPLFDEGAYADVAKKTGKLSTWLCDRPPLLGFSSGITPAWLVVWEMRRRGFDFKMELSGAHHYESTTGPFTVFNDKTKVSFTCHNAVCGNHEGAGGNGHGTTVEADTAPLAVCRAALRAVGSGQ